MNTQFKTLKSKAQSAITGSVVALALTLFAVPGEVQAASGPFSGLSGSWAGPGTITLASGARETIRCRAKYNVDGAGSSLNLALRCASASYKFELQSSISHDGSGVSGVWNEIAHKVGGTISGSASGETIQVRAEGPFSALLAVNTRANQQSISIQSPGSAMQEVAINLKRHSK
jgi:hypothetical protein